MSEPSVEHRLDNLELQGVDNRNRLVQVERSVEAVSQQVVGVAAKLDTVINAVTTVTARPQWDLHKALDLATKGVVLSVAVAGLITYISSNINSAFMMENKLRSEFLQMRLDNGWYKPPMVIRAPGGQVAPQ